jgi:hypothetical protein
MVLAAPTFYYNGLLPVCDSISFFNVSFSSCKGSLTQKETIFVSANDVRLGVQNIAAVLVLEEFTWNGLCIN